MKMRISPPISKLDIPYQHYQVDAAKGGEFKTNKGSRIRVPKQAFGDASGKALEGQVELRFREFHDPVDFFLSGIPMCYDSAGVRYQFESAGMIELLGFKDGKPVYILPGKQVEIELDSRRIGGTSYNVYKFDTASCNWVYLGKDKLARKTVSEATGEVAVSADSVRARFEALPEVKSLNQQTEQAKADCEKQLKQLPKPSDEPKKPVKAVAGRQHFNVDIDYNEFPEMKQYKSTVFEIGPENKDVNQDIFDKRLPMEDFVISEGTRKGENYTMTLSRGAEVVKLIVYPVFEGKNYDKAMAEFNAKFKQYEEERNSRVVAENKIKASEEAMIETYNRRKKELEENYTAQRVSMDKMGALVNSFTVKGFGVYNCDAPCYYPKGRVSAVRLVDASGTLLSSIAVYLVDADKNGLFTYHGADIPEFRFNPKSRNLLWTVTGGKFYVLRNEQFSTIGDPGHSDVKMEAVDKDFKNADELKAYLGI
jgi:hypothetical protein